MEVNPKVKSMSMKGEGVGKKCNCQRKIRLVSIKNTVIIMATCALSLNFPLLELDLHYPQLPRASFDRKRVIASDEGNGTESL